MTELAKVNMAQGWKHYLLWLSISSFMKEDVSLCKGLATCCCIEFQICGVAWKFMLHSQKWKLYQSYTNPRQWFHNVVHSTEDRTAKSTRHFTSKGTREHWKMKEGVSLLFPGYSCQHHPSITIFLEAAVAFRLHILTVFQEPTALYPTSGVE